MNAWGNQRGLYIKEDGDWKPLLLLSDRRRSFLIGVVVGTLFCLVVQVLHLLWTVS